MRDILSIAIILCLLILVAVYFLSDPDPETSNPTLNMAPEQTLSQDSAPARDDEPARPQGQ